MFTYSCVVDVVVGSDHAQVQGCNIHLVFNTDTLGLFQVSERVLHELRQVIWQVTMSHTCSQIKQTI